MRRLSSGVPGRPVPGHRQDRPRWVMPTAQAPAEHPDVLLLVLIVIGMAAGWAAHLLIGNRRRNSWGEDIVIGLLGSLATGLVVSLLAGGRAESQAQAGRARPPALGLALRLALGLPRTVTAGAPQEALIHRPRRQ
jgi:uncharacterized membrane protein YeaQ/YmgE (transglycosylase-associated protein family)